ncbi:hypothetical protein PTRA_a1784 [Pseudoalteromonas translucida KMM 520]|uniref:Prepilin-type N-terminal cleavage/methylation domain-containing protein n=1 Tax=Pseudoalteromonas translucida KMM 520 TaxID=1315283 RepID=A0A0U2WZ04_9GAMM|nr:prepilin-type N-terminal cleavage/methylation domain-containing protein [Pseudoalteromonas translucida]ALS32945.1 hypothetical protein PTRA_a1784 [Pseudoalteromonas translucida KMM 520]
MSEVIVKQRGFTLVELMVALAASMFLLGGVSLAYSSINSTTNTAKGLENTLEVIRFSSNVFTRSFRQTSSVPVYLNNILTVQQNAGARACTGEIVNTPFTEQYSHEDDSLFCDIGDGKVKILKGLTAINFNINDKVVTVFVTAINLPGQFNNALAIDIALSQIIMNKAFS